MPRYDYICPDGHVEEWHFSMVELEAIESLEDPDRPGWQSLVYCWCLKPARRVWSATPAIFRGSGWASKS